MIFLITNFACKNIEPAPTDIDNLSHYLWQHLDDEEDDALIICPELRRAHSTELKGILDRGEHHDDQTDRDRYDDESILGPVAADDLCKAQYQRNGKLKNDLECEH